MFIRLANEHILNWLANLYRGFNPAQTQCLSGVWGKNHAELEPVSQKGLAPTGHSFWEAITCFSFERGWKSFSKYCKHSWDSLEMLNFGLVLVYQFVSWWFSMRAVLEVFSVELVWSILVYNLHSCSTGNFYRKCDLFDSFLFEAYSDRRKFRSQTSDNMQRWKSRGGKSRGGEVKKWKDKRWRKSAERRCRCAKR